MMMVMTIVITWVVSCTCTNNNDGDRWWEFSLDGLVCATLPLAQAIKVGSTHAACLTEIKRQVKYKDKTSRQRQRQTPNTNKRQRPKVKYKDQTSRQRLEKIPDMVFLLIYRWQIEYQVYSCQFILTKNQTWYLQGMIYQYIFTLGAKKEIWMENIRGECSCF